MKFVVTKVSAKGDIVSRVWQNQSVTCCLATCKTLQDQLFEKCFAEHQK